MKTICTEVYQYHELSPAAQEIARQWLTNCIGSDTDWADFTENDFLEALALLGFKVHERSGRKSLFWALWSHYDGAAFDATYRHERGGLRKVMDEYGPDSYIHDAAKRLHNLQKRNFWNVTGTVSSGRNGQSVSTSCDRYNPRGFDFELSQADQDEFDSIVRDLCSGFIAGLESEYEYQTGKEAIAETMEANGYTFTADGKRFG